jgi:hypothetical protein
MTEYKVLDCKSPLEAEAKMNELARDGWKVISIIPWAALTARIAVTLERTID